jgi:hypothetical protein
MSRNKFTCPPQTASGQGTFSDNLVGFQLVQGGGLTQGNFEFVESVTEKTNRNFGTGTFSGPISLDSLKIENITQSKTIVENTFKVYPNFDLSQVSTFTLYGSLVKRISTSITNIINYFPAGIESNFIGLDISTGVTANNIEYDGLRDETSLEFDLARIRNPFDIDFTFNSQRNISLREMEVSELRDLTNNYTKYSLYYKGIGYELKGIDPTDSLTNGVLKFYVSGNLFSGETLIYDNLVLRPNDYEVNKVFKENLDEVENFLLNRTVSPIYTATFNVPTESNDGTYYVEKSTVTWPLYGDWNLDILTESFTSYLDELNQISEFFDLFRTNLISRFMTTGAFKEFDTVGQKMEKVLQIYGRSFDETQKFVSSLSFMTSVNYNVGDDIPSQLLKNLAQTLGWNTNISPISNDDLLSSVFGQKNLQKSVYEGVPISQTPDELNYQFYRNLILNSAYLFKSKGTRKSIEILLRLIGAPDALIDFNEYVYVADQKINLSQFEQQYVRISGGTYVQELPSLDPANLFKIQGIEYTGFTTTTIIKDANITSDEFPIDDEGYPSAIENGENYFFQMGSGWFEQTPQHRAPEIVDITNSVFTGQNPNYQTILSPYTYGEIYLEKYKNFPFMDLGFKLIKQVDNNKSWADYEVGLRSNLDSTFNALYQTSDDRLVINVKNVDLFLNPAQGLVYDVWSMSKEFNYPIPNQGLNWVQPTPCDPNPNTPYPQRGGIDWTEINPQPNKRTFFEFAQTFWKNTINVRNRQFITDGKTGGYPTLQSIYWKYLESNETVNIPNDNFTYQTMMDYVNGLGSYWIRLIEQMIPATTIWNTGVRYENSIFHRQKFVWRRQRGCQLIPIPCKPCNLTTNLLNNDCPTQSIQCNITQYRTSQNAYNLVLTTLLNNYLNSNSLDINNCVLNSIISTWFIDIRIDDVVVYSGEFFTGYGYNDPNLSVPTPTNWSLALIDGLNSLYSYGYGYYFTNSDNTVVVYNKICSVSEEDVNFKLNIGINFQISCN